MKQEYDFSKMKSRKNPYASKLKNPITKEKRDYTPLNAKTLESHLNDLAESANGNEDREVD